jgi:transcriptional regulator with XRE-family HTH domain
MPMSAAERHLRHVIAQCILEGRRALGWSQAELARRGRVSAGSVALLETGGLNATLEMVGRVLEPLGIVLDLRFRRPFSEGRQRDQGHAVCVAYVQRRLERAGWLVAREVEIWTTGARGWIDVLALSPDGRHLLVIEVKTVLLDVGQIERTVGWYQRQALGAARRLGWRPATTTAWLLLLMTESNEAAIRGNREALAQSFPARAGEPLDRASPAERGLAMIDPASRRRDWLVRSRTDGRRSPAPYEDYRDFVTRRSMPVRTRATATRRARPTLPDERRSKRIRARTVQRG